MKKQQRNKSANTTPSVHGNGDQKKAKPQHKTENHTPTPTAVDVQQATDDDRAEPATKVSKEMSKPKPQGPTFGAWYDLVPPLENPPSVVTKAEVVEAKKKEAIEHYDKELTIFEKKRAHSSTDDKWLSTVIKSGTVSDKVAAYTMLVQSNPVYNLKALDSLIAMCTKKGRREAQLAIEATKDLFLTNLLPDRKLKSFQSQPLTANDIKKAHLVYWLFEDALRNRYATFVQALEQGSHDTLAHTKSSMIKSIFDLLSKKPEQEKVLLAALANKLGDPDRKMASKVSYLLSLLVQEHPGMKLVVVKEVEQLLFRSNVAKKAQYYAVIFLNQLILTKQDAQLAQRLIKIYFALFKSAVASGDVESKLMSALLSGVNRAFPFTPKDDASFDEQTDMLFKLAHTGNFNTRIQALSLLFQVMSARKSVSDRFYRALYEQILSPDLRVSSKQTMFLNLLYKAMKEDVSIERTKAFAKRLFQICFYQEPTFVCGLLFLISEITKVKPALKGLSMQNECGEDEEEVFKDVVEEDDVEGTRTAPKHDADSEDDDENDIHGDTKMAAVANGNGDTNGTHTDKDEKAQYDPRKREPLYAHAGMAASWELVELCRFFHPSVEKWSHFVLNGDSIEYAGDPLKDFTTMAFLDRFVYKKPKSEEKREKGKGSSIMQPLKISRSKVAAPVNSDEFLKLSRSQVPDHEQFFHRFFAEKAKHEGGKAKKKKVKDVDEQDFDIIQDTEDMFGGEEDSEEDEFADQLFDEEMKKMGGDEMDDEEMEEDGPMEFGESDDDNEPVVFGEDDEEEGDADMFASMDGIDEEVSETEDKPSDGRKRKKKGGAGAAIFASADEFAHLLETSGSSGLHPKQEAWEESKSRPSRGGSSRGRGRGGRGSSSRGRPNKRGRRH
eukprot:GILK01005290.1.p1 GENE.GILK01005290.1~~GILK01005290.1.p1  ORF type:complete len:894 (-),score=206.64 GILK01005290.1:141-2822(-)